MTSSVHAAPSRTNGPSSRTAHDAAARVEDRVAALLIGDSRPMRELRAAVARAGASSLPVLVTGPTGAGKELVARGVHLASGRTGPLVAFNVAAIAEALFESAVFGHVRGAFTGAQADSPGYLTEAHGGTAFLDEVGALALGAQAKLLRAVELREFRPVGAARDRRSDFRLVSATNADVEALVRAGGFRADLVERLGGIVLEVPPLSARREDVPQLVAHFALRAAPTGAMSAEFSADALAVLQAHAWPRNVRQLKNAVERALAASPGGLVDAATARAALPRGTPSAATPTTGADEDTFARRRLAAVLRACGGDTARAAATLGVSRATVYRRMARLGIPSAPTIAPDPDAG